MRHARKDYDRIQDPALGDDPSLLGPGSKPIAEDEPVFLIRAADRTAPDAVMAWARLQNTQTAAGRKIAEVAEDWALEMEDWQKAHPQSVKSADLAIGEEG